MELLNEDASLGSDDGGSAGLATIKGAFEACLNAAIGKRGVHIDVDAFVEGTADARQLRDAWAEVLEPACAVGTAVKQHASAWPSMQVVAILALSVSKHVVAERGIDAHNLANLVCCSNNLLVKRYKTRLHGLHEQDLLLPCHVSDFTHLLCREHGRLLAQHSLASAQCGKGPLMVELVGEREIDGIHLRVREQRLMCMLSSVCLICGDIEVPHPCGCLLGRAAADGRELCAILMG